MTQDTHTPGPWYLHDGLMGYEIHNKNLIVAHITTEPNAVSEDANARLIAAAPELLEALEALIGADGPDYIRSKYWDMARAAIAKARGQA